MAGAQATNWCVITGAPSSGKTSVINVLSAQGYATCSEVARLQIEKLLRKGEDLAHIRSDPGHIQALQKSILEQQKAREGLFREDRLVFMDRGLGDSITYFRLAGLDTAAAVAAAGERRYRAVFIFERLPVVKDDVRTESESDAEKIDRMIEEDYRGLGYDPIRVPVLSVEERAHFILEKLGMPQP